MNRLKLWLYALVVTVASVAAVRALTLQLETRARATADARLAAAAARAGAELRRLEHEVGAIAALAARDPRLGETLHAKEAEPPAPPSGKQRRAAKAPPPQAAPDPAAEEAAWQQAARASVEAAEKAAGFSLSESTQIAAGNREWLARKAAAAGDADRALVDLLGAAIGGEPRRAVLHWNGQLWAGAASPAGAGAGLVLLAPLDAGFAAAVAKDAGAELTITAPGVKLVTVARPSEAQALAAAAAAVPGVAVSSGKLGPVDLALFGLALPKVPLLFAAAPAHRALATAIPGVKGAHAVVSTSLAPLLAPLVRDQYLGLLAAVAVLLLGLVVGLLVTPSEVAAPVPAELLAAASRIERGDLAARAPALAGQLGTVSAALNRALEAAAARTAEGPSVSQEFFARAAPPPPEAEPSAFEFPARPAPAPLAEARPPAPQPAQRLGAGGAFEGSAFEASPVPAPRAPAPPPSLAAPLTTAPELLQQAAPPPAAAPAGEEEGHWREVFADFVRVRAECGEAADGLTFERFRQKLESNKAALVAKYGCRTVRFQVYVKEGRAALKATPVR